jgi:hypothetical protein
MKFKIFFIISIVALTGCKHDMQAVFPDTVQNETYGAMDFQDFRITVASNPDHPWFRQLSASKYSRRSVKI